MNKRISMIWGDPLVSRCIKGGLTIIGLQGVVIALFFSKLSPIVPLYYSLPWGEGQLVPSFYITLFPLLDIAICIVNICVFLLSKENIFFARVLLGFWFLAVVLSFIGLINILFLVT